MIDHMHNMAKSVQGAITGTVKDMGIHITVPRVTGTVRDMGIHITVPKGNARGNLRGYRSIEECEVRELP